MSRAARLRCLQAVHARFVIDLQTIGLRAASRRQAADDDLGLGVLEALRDVVEIFALGSCGGRAVERQRALRPRDGRRIIAPSDTFPHNRLADVAARPYNSNFLVRLIYARGEGHAHCRGAQRRRCGREEEDASHLQRMTRLWRSCVAESSPAILNYVATKLAERHLALPFLLLHLG